MTRDRLPSLSMIYLDNHATTSLDPRVLDAMLPFLRHEFGNPASRHAWGRRAAEAVDGARAQVAALFGAEPDEIVFTSGATEANNLALRGTALRHPGGHLIVSAIEHPAVLDTARALAAEGWSLTELTVDPRGCVAPDDLRAALRPDTFLVSIMAANNEIGTIQPVAELAAIAPLLHTDASQALGKTALPAGAQLISLTGHKIHGPIGAGALYVKRGTDLAPLQHGGGQEGGRRAGTLNTPGIVGLGAACALLAADPAAECARMAALRDRLQAQLEAAIPGLQVNGDPDARLPGNLHVCLPGVASADLLPLMPDLAVSTGAACHADASPVMAAIGADGTRALRFGIGRFTTEQEVDEGARIVTNAFETLKTQRAAPS
ncbi:MAG: cysteine desulfurase family protein [Planctomycetota bacterium]